MSSAVDEPGGVEEEAVPQETASVEGDEGGLSPEFHGNNGGNKEAEDEDQGQVESSLECANGIGEEVGQVEFSSLLLDLEDEKCKRPTDNDKPGGAS